ncbi:MAG: NTP transferase domain-containing protein [Candidatus Jordarchaeaceae archaeon]
MVIRAIILAAGVNSRLGRYAKGLPKSLLPLGSLSLLERQLDFLINSGLRKKDIYVVSGYMASKIKLVHDNLILNEKYRETDNAYSLHIALDYLLKLPEVDPADQVIVLDCDLVYDKNLIPMITKTGGRNMLVTRKEHLLPGSKEEVVLVDDIGRVTQIFCFSDQSGHGSGKINSNEQFVYTGIMTLSNNAAWELNQMLRDKKFWTKWYTVPLSHLLSKVCFFNFPLSPPSFCFDVDTKEDYERARNLLAQHEAASNEK